MERPSSRRKFARSSANAWTSWCPTPESARLHSSKITRWRILTISSPRMCAARFSWCSDFCPSSLGAHAVVGKPGLDTPTILAYASTKGALETLVKNWAAILGPQGIRVNAVAPGVIDTDMSNFTKTEAGREVTLGMQALKRIGKPEDVADVVAFVASDGARWITGASIPVDGGSKL